MNKLVLILIAFFLISFVSAIAPPSLSSHPASSSNAIVPPSLSSQPTSSSFITNGSIINTYTYNNITNIYNGSQWTTNGLDIFYDDSGIGSVGIGLSEPSAMLDVNGDIHLFGDIKTELIGEENAYLCIDTSGKFYKSITSCKPISTYNATYDAIIGDNATWNESRANELYYSITNPSGFISSFTELDPKATSWINNNNSAWLSTYNSSYLTSTYNISYHGLINNASYLSTYNASYDAKISDNVNWNKTYADTLYAGIGTTGGNSSWNETYARTLFSLVTWNKTYADTLYAPIGLSSGNLSWNQSLADTLYSAITWNYNQTTPAITYIQNWINNNNSAWLSTYNSSYITSTYNISYAGSLNNASYLSTYNASYDNWALVGNNIQPLNISKGINASQYHNNIDWISTPASSLTCISVCGNASSLLSAYGYTYTCVASMNMNDGTSLPCNSLASTTRGCACQLT